MRHRYLEREILEREESHGCIHTEVRFRCVALSKEEIQRISIALGDPELGCLKIEIDRPWLSAMNPTEIDDPTQGTSQSLDGYL